MVDRIQKILHYKKLTASKFADMVGAPRSTISHIISGRNNPSLEFLQKILDTFPDIQTEWLIRGEGSMVAARNTLFTEEDFEDKPEMADFASQKPEKETVAPSINEIIPPNPANIHEEAGRDPQKMAYSEEKEEIKPIASEERKNDIERTDPGFKTGFTGKKTARIIFIYSDGTFSEFIPSSS
jgi:transcriptional regulator with XRE-family HTH domain